jgi:N-acetylmuramoyl-L-alanine amidase
VPRPVLLVLILLLVLTAGLYTVAAQRSAAPRQPAAHPVQADRPAVLVRQVRLPASTGLKLAPQTCIEYAPLHGNQHRVVFIDPGHGGLDSGAVGVTSAGVPVEEKTLTLKVGLDVLTLLRDEGYTVVMSRVTDTLIIDPQPGDVDGELLTVAGSHRDGLARIDCANAAHAQALVAIHFNAFSDPSVNGAETFYDPSRRFSAANHRLANLVQRNVLAQLHGAGWPVPDRGVHSDLAVGTALSSEAVAYGHLLELGPAARGYLPQASEMPGTLTEPLFITHPAEADVAVSAKGEQAIARGIAQAIPEFFAVRS